MLGEHISCTATAAMADIENAMEKVPRPVFKTPGDGTDLETQYQHVDIHRHDINMI